MKRTKLYFGQFINKLVNIMLDEETLYYNRLPENVKAVVNNQFPNQPIDFIKEKGDAYTLMFNNGTEVTINKDGSCQYSNDFFMRYDIQETAA